jgi:NAD(P)-dependent dehydrogenase (short-subunit alcohol dehydrogenase family)
MSSKLAGKVVMITGASGEIGSATALELAKEGASGIALHYSRNRRRAVEIARKARRLGCESIVLKANLSNPGQAKSLVRRICEEFGKLDVLVCMAGHRFSSEDWFGKFEELTPEQFMAPINVDLLGNAYVAQAAASEMKRRGGGRIVFVGSTPAITGDSVGMTYSIAKAGLLSLTRSLAQYLGPNKIQVNAVALGSIGTKATLDHLTPRQKETLIDEASLRRFGTPLEVARKIVFLSSDESDFVTGQTIIVDGGYAMR